MHTVAFKGVDYSKFNKGDFRHTGHLPIYLLHMYRVSYVLVDRNFFNENRLSD